jgi:hypothetical protein
MVRTGALPSCSASSVRTASRELVELPLARQLELSFAHQTRQEGVRTGR